MGRARADIDEAKRGNSRDFNVYRVEAEYSLARAKSSATPAEARLILTEARARIVKVQDIFKSSLKSHAFALRARLSLVLGDSDDCVASAEAAIKSTDTPTPNSHLLLCAALTQKRNWVHLSRAAQRMRETFPVPVIQAWSSIFMLLADLFSRQPLEDIQEMLRQCETDLALYSGFDPTARSEWTEISWELPTSELGSDERNLALALCEFLFGRRRYDTFVETLRLARREQRK